MRLIYIISDKQQTADFINLNTLKKEKFDYESNIEHKNRFEKR